MTDKNPDKIKNMFDKIAPHYDILNDIMSFFIHKKIKEKAVKLLDIKDNDKILDVCSGTGDILDIIFKKYKTKLYGLDFSSKMLNIARKRLDKTIELKEADATCIPFDDNYFDKITICFGLRNIKEEKKATDEMKRVLKSGGVLLHLDFGGSNIFLNFCFDIIVKIISKFIKNGWAYNYLIQSKNEFKKPKEIVSMFENNGFKFIQKKDFLFKMLQAQIFLKK